MVVALAADSAVRRASMRLLAVIALAVAGSCSTGAPAVPERTVAPSSTSSTVPSSVASAPPDAAPVPTAGAFGAGTAWLAVEGDGAVARVDLSLGRVVRRYEDLRGAHNLAVAPDGTVIVTLPRSGRVALLKEDSRKLVDLGGSPHDAKVAGTTVVIANEGSSRLDLVSVSGERRGEVRLKANPHDVAVSADGRSAVASLDGSDELAVIDIERGSVSRYVRTRKRPHDLLFAPDSRLWVTDWNGDVNVLSPALSLVGTVPGTEAHHLAFSAEGGRAWIADNGSRQVLVVDTATLKVAAVIPLDGAPHHLAVTPDGSRVLVSNNGSGSLVVLDAAAARTLGSIPVGSGPHGIG